MAILDLKKKIEPYLKTATGYVKQMLSSKHVIMEDGNDLETTVTELNRNIISVEHKDIGIHVVRKGSYTDIPIDLNQFGMSKIISVIPILQGRSSSPNYGLLTLGLYEFNQNTATLRVFNTDGSDREPRINVCVIGFKQQ